MPKFSPQRKFLASISVFTLLLVQNSLSHCTPASTTIKIQSEDIQINPIPTDIDRGFIVAFLPKSINQDHIILKYSTNMETIFEVVNVLENEKIFYARQFSTQSVTDRQNKPNNRIIKNQKYQNFYYKGNNNKYLQATD